jgi:hypothetical protein
VTARPRHLRLVATGDGTFARTPRAVLVDAAWGAPALSVAHGDIAADHRGGRSALLLEAARTVLPPRPPAAARERPEPGLPPDPWGTPARTATCRPLVLSPAQLAFLEDLALLRRERAFRCDDGPSPSRLERAPEEGSVYVRRLIHSIAALHGAGPGRLERRPSWVARAFAAARTAIATLGRCAASLPRLGRARRALGGGAGGA